MTSRALDHGRVNDPVLEIEGLSVGYHVYGAAPVAAVRDVSLSIAPGEIVGLVGESGSGKTTLARSIMGMVPAPGRIDGGSIRFDGHELTELSPDAYRAIRGRDLAMVVPNPRGDLNPLVPVGRQVGNVAGVHLGLSKGQMKDAALEMFRAVSIPDPERRYHAYPHELSGGMAQRIVIAMALVCSPRFVISDDATSGLDVTVQAQVLELLRSLVREKGTAMLYITRDIGVAAHFCDRIAILYEGLIVEMAPKSVLFEDPKHPYTNMLMAAFAQNPRLRRRWHLDRPSAFAGRGEPASRCPYAGRCVKARRPCIQEHPELRQLAPGHLVRCHYPVER